MLRRSTVLLLSALCLLSGSTATSQDDKPEQPKRVTKQVRLRLKAAPAPARPLQLKPLQVKPQAKPVKARPIQLKQKVKQKVIANKKGQAGLAPTHANVPYGSNPRQVIDFWQASGEGPRPMLVYIHGGGWVGGSKNRSPALVKPFLESNN